MTKKSDENPDLILVAGVIMTFIFFATGGFSGIEKFVERRLSHEKLTTVRYRGEWSFGEYRECESVNLKTEDKEPELACTGALSGGDKVFKVSFSGDLTYDSDEPDSAIHRWLCRRNDGDPSFSCTAKETPEQKRAEEQKQAPRQQQVAPEAVQQPVQQPVINDEGLPESIRSCIARFPNPYSGSDYYTYHNDLKADCERDPQRTTP